MELSPLEIATVEMPANLLAAKAASREAFERGVPTAFASANVIERYFQKYGSTQRKFDFHPSPGIYIGYVRVSGQPEFLSVILMRPGGRIAASFYPNVSHGNDMLGLMGKKSFADEVASKFIEAGGR